MSDTLGEVAMTGYVHVVTDCEQGKAPHDWHETIMTATSTDPTLPVRTELWVSCLSCGTRLTDFITALETALATSRQALWDCFRVAGGDTDGDPTPAAVTSGLEAQVVAIVTELRDELDEERAALATCEARLAESEQNVVTRADDTRSYFATGESMVPPAGEIGHSAEYFDGAFFAIAIMAGEVTPWGVGAPSGEPE